MHYDIAKERIYDWVDLTITLDKYDIAKLLETGSICSQYVKTEEKRITINYKNE